MTVTPPEHGSPVPNPESPTDQAPPTPAPTPPPPAPPKRPNIHVTALIVWLTIFPLVAIVSVLLAPVIADWHPVLRAFVVTLIVVPIAAYWLMPQMFRWYAAIERRRAARHADKGML
ncbi:hypothetical protein [Agromyces mariniharenae]|uniref:Uncharacterized protein n=1 Tax=Agromyces mariniharenae TaxID=2604423 RepID=A0A5S4V4N3_9MICO|nr:hypothetical protein [Agromyces mariniharenae]TYL53966.1 hypothetical protein FYC51_10185 [Agromyces mariniharenae]